MKLPVFSQKGQETGDSVELNSRIFSVEKIKGELVHAVADAALANARQGTAATKTRGMVRGGGKKPWKQKGTGRARAGSIRSPLWRGGGIIFGPNPNRNFHKKVNRKSRRLALFSVLTDRAQEGGLAIVDNLDIGIGKTRELLKVLESLKSKILGRKLLLVVKDKQENLVRAARNLQDLRMLHANNLNILDLLWADSILMTKEALAVLEQTYLK